MFRISKGISDLLKPFKRSRQKIKLSSLSLVLISVVSAPVSAHEYWLDPVGSQWKVGDSLAVDIRNGDDFTGTSYPYYPAGLQRGGLISDNQRQDLSGRLGDYPALNFQLKESGLHLVLLDTTRREMIYNNLSRFENFLDYHGFNDVMARHQQRGLSTSTVTEHYYRYAKALVHVIGEPSLEDSLPTDKSSDSTAESSSMNVHAASMALQTQQQRLEIVPVNNPIKETTFRMQLLFEGEPLADRQVELFHRGSDQKTVRHIVTSDVSGQATFDVAAEGEYMINSVQVVEPSGDESGPDWITLWASLFFEKDDWFAE